MEAQKQELIKLIENLDWDKFNLGTEMIMTTMSANHYATIMHLLLINQKEKTIEQKLEDLGFKLNWEREGFYFNREREGFYYCLDSGVYDEYKDCITIGYKLVSHNRCNIHCQTILPQTQKEEILKFANYLVSIKNGGPK